jgi:hypothetical protein
MMNRAELEHWLGELSSEAVPFAQIADVLHILVEASRRSVAIADAGELRELCFAVTVLRDVFPDDTRIRSWLRTPLAAIDGVAPADLVAAGRIHEFADLAVVEWNRPRDAAPRRMGAILAPA